MKKWIVQMFILFVITGSLGCMSSDTGNQILRTEKESLCW